MDETLLLQLIEQIYQAAIDADCARSLAAQLARAFNSESCFFSLCHRLPVGTPEISSVLSATPNFTGWVRNDYINYYHARNVWFERGWVKGCPAIVLGQELIDVPSLLRTEWSDFLRATNTLHVLGAQYQVVGDILGMMGIHRPPRGDEFDEHDCKKMALLLPHFQRAMQMRERLALSEHRGGLTLDLLDGLSVAIILVTGDGTVQFANRIAERLLTKQGGLATVKGLLRPQHSGDVAAFGKLLHDTVHCATSSGGVIYLTLPMGKKQPVLVTRMYSDNISMDLSQPVAAVIISDPDPCKSGRPDYFIRRYGLTLAEAKLLCALVSGRDLAEYAEAANIGIGTAKTHLKSVFAKTDCHKQSDLIRAVLSDPLFRLIPQI